MPRLPRLDAPGVVHHVMARGIEKTTIFSDHNDRENFVQRLGGLTVKGGMTIYGWVLLPNHFHLLVRTGRIPLSRNMRSLMSGHAGYFNRRHHRVGHLFQNRFKSIVCEEEAYLLELVRYLHLNPLRANIVKDFAALDRYPYSGHLALIGKVDRPWQETGEILGRFGRRTENARKGYRAFVQAGAGQGRRPDLMGGGLLRSQGGWLGVQSLRKGREAYLSDERILGSTDFVGQVMEEAEALALKRNTTVDLVSLRMRIIRDLGLHSHTRLNEGGRRKELSQARAAIAYVWTRYLGRSGRALAAELGITPQAVYGAAKQAEETGMVEPEDLIRWCK